MSPSTSAVLAAVLCSIAGALIGASGFAAFRTQRNRLRRHWLPTSSRGSEFTNGLSRASNALNEKLRSRLGLPKSQRALPPRYLAAGLAVGLCLVFATAIGMVPVKAALLVGLGLLGIPAAIALRVIRNRTLAIRAIEGAMPAEIEKLAVYLAGGYSLVGAITRVAERTKSPCAEIFEIIARGLKGGAEISVAVGQARELFEAPSLGRLANVLEGALYGADLVKAARSEAAAQRAAIHRLALAEMEKNSQKIWIPITIAALVPGIVLIFVPFVAVMKADTSG